MIDLKGTTTTLNLRRRFGVLNGPRGNRYDGVFIVLGHTVILRQGSFEHDKNYLGMTDIHRVSTYFHLEMSSHSTNLKVFPNYSQHTLE